MSCVRFSLMILTSTPVMFVLMYLNTHAWVHVFFSHTRVYRAILSDLEAGLTTGYRGFCSCAGN